MSGSITAPELSKCKVAFIKTNGHDGMVPLAVHVPLGGFLEQYLNLQSASKSQTSQVSPFTGDVWDLSVANPVKGKKDV